VSAGQLIARLDGVRESGPGRWMSRCPAHEDRSPSLSIRETTDGTVLVRCFAGCGAADVLEAVGLTFADLFPPRPADHRGKPQRRPFDPMQVLVAVAHEALTVAMIAEACAELDVINRERLNLAASRIQNALNAVGPLPVSEKIKRLRRGEYVPA
jgi:hypothetical protein